MGYYCSLLDLKLQDVILIDIYQCSWKFIRPVLLMIFIFVFSAHLWNDLCPLLVKHIFSDFFSVYVSGITSRGGGHRGQSAPPPPAETSDREISADLPGKERQGKKGIWSRKRNKIEKGNVEN